MEVLKTHKTLRYDVAGLQETRQSEMYTVYCSGECGGEREHEGHKGVAATVTQKFTHAAAHPPEYINDRLVANKFRLHGRHSSNVTVVVGYARKNTSAVKLKLQFRPALSQTLKEITPGVNIF